MELAEAIPIEPQAIEATNLSLETDESWLVVPKVVADGDDVPELMMRAPLAEALAATMLSGSGSTEDNQATQSKFVSSGGKLCEGVPSEARAPSARALTAPTPSKLQLGVEGEEMEHENLTTDLDPSINQKAGKVSRVPTLLEEETERVATAPDSTKVESAGQNSTQSVPTEKEEGEKESTSSPQILEVEEATNEEMETTNKEEAPSGGKWSPKEVDVPA